MDTTAARDKRTQQKRNRGSVYAIPRVQVLEDAEAASAEDDLIGRRRRRHRRLLRHHRVKRDLHRRSLERGLAMKDRGQTQGRLGAQEAVERALAVRALLAEISEIKDFVSQSLRLQQSKRVLYMTI